MLHVSMASSVSRSDTNRLLTVGVLKIPDVWIPSIQSVGIERCDPPRDVMHTAGHSALCRCWICDTPSMCYPPWWWACGTHSAIINDLVCYFIFACLFFHSCTKRHLSAVF
ncbi:uncharacterized protein NPIL_568161 [Nephila pilipes]|uniref:Uncharacterized protein n=1 Tax=Nephila pilipes TaxID=299642 RepID=A0A8X6UDM0_NEPPI|nr:uncharacterized protein NPIL_568161 [Nephila pilipes]